MHVQAPRAMALTLVVGCASAAQAQAPSSAQVWEVRFAVDGAGDSSTQVNITIQARVGILPNSSPQGDANLGVGRVGGTPFRVRATDPGPVLAGAHRLARGFTGEVDGSGQTRVDIHGEPLAGHFFQFRAGFPPAGPESDNQSVFNGQFSLDAAGRAVLDNVVGSRADNYDGVPLGAATIVDGSLAGEFANVYRFSYFPSGGAPRDIAFDVSNLSARYIFGMVGVFSTAANQVNLPAQAFVARVPDPASAGAFAIGGWLWGSARRRMSSARAGARSSS